MTRKSLLSNLRMLLGNDRGNFLMTAAIAIPVLFASTGLALDYIRLVNNQRALQNALDAAAVASAASMMTGHSTAATVNTYAANMVMAEIGTLVDPDQKTEIANKLKVNTTTTVSGGATTYTVTLSSNFNVALTPFAQFLGFTSRPVAGFSTTQSQSTTKNALSMYVVLDRSGSMSFTTDVVDTTKTKCQNYTIDNWSQYPNLAQTKPCYVDKMGALKTAAGNLFDELDSLEQLDTSDSIIRLGGVSFTDVMQTPQPIAWGTSGMRTYVGNLPAYPSGGTDMTGGMNTAYQSLIAQGETDAQAAKGNTSFLKFIVLMTDGENTGSSSTWNPALDVKTLATCTAARQAGITIYTVAFMAPANGITMLQTCAGNPANAYVANDMQSLVKAFADIGSRATQKATRILN